jgi:hypothetical protein
MGDDRGRGDCGVHAAAPALRFEKLRAWSLEAERALSRTFNGDLARIKANVDAGLFELWKIDGGRSYMVTRIDGDILTVCCYQGRNLKADAPLIIETARRQGLRSVDFIAKSRGLGRLMRCFGASELGTIFTVST